MFSDVRPIYAPFPSSYRRQLSPITDVSPQEAGNQRSMCSPYMTWRHLQAGEAPCPARLKTLTPAGNECKVSSHHFGSRLLISLCCPLRFLLTRKR